MKPEDNVQFTDVPKVMVKNLDEKVNDLQR